MTPAALLWAAMVSACLGSSVAQTVTQPQPEMSVQEAETVTLACTFETGEGNYNLFWYKQPPNGEMILIIRQEAFKKQNATNDRFSANFQKERKHFGLRISDSQLQDAGMYFCALRGGGSQGKLTFGKGTTLSVKPNVKNPDPAVYQLRSPKSSRTSICLFTDFDSNTSVTQAKGSSTFGSDGTVLDMKSTHSKSYGALLWSDSTDFGCKDTFNETFYPSSEFSCDVTLVEKSFETDINLNFQNLSVIGFRILLLKVAGFNLLMTLRLWSS